MAARIGVARLLSDPDTFVMASDFDPDKHTGLLCPDRRCNCVLLGVRAGTRQINGEQIDIAPFFRLTGSAEKDGKGHAPVCRFNVERTVTRLVAISREIKKFGSDPDLLSAGRRHLAEYRLHILMEILGGRQANNHGGSGELGVIPKPYVGTKYRSSGQNLKPYLRLAKAVLSLVARVQDESDLGRLIRLKYASQTIPWENYFFNIGDYDRLYNHLIARLQRNLTHPVAVVITLAGKRPAEQPYGDWLLPCKAARVRTLAGQEYALKPVLYFKDQSLAEKVCNETNLLVCAIPRLSAVRQVTKPGLRPEVSLRMTIISYAQVCQFRPV